MKFRFRILKEDMSNKKDDTFCTEYQIRNVSSEPVVGASLILKNGMFVNLKNDAHSKFIDKMLKKKIDTNKFNAVWINDGTYEKGCVYISLPQSPLNNNQYNSLLKWLDKIHGNIEIMSRDIFNNEHNIYDMDDYLPEDIIKRIKRFYSSGRLYENIINEVYPNKGESKKDFISRFMSVTKGEYPDIKQRYAIANDYWSRRNKKRESIDEYYEEPPYDYHTGDVVG